jgi:hypothetical protein
MSILINKYMNKKKAETAKKPVRLILKGYPVSEEGGATTSYGEAVMWCDCDGKLLNIFYTPRHVHLCNGEHTFFFLNKALCGIKINDEPRLRDTG